MKRPNFFRIPVTILILLLPLLAVTPASADAPVRSVYTDDFSITYPGSQNACGFDVTVHIYGQIKIIAWYDEAGNPTREMDGAGQWHFTWDAGYGKTLTGLVQGSAHYTYLSATERILKVTGTNLLTIVPGYGPGVGSAGQLIIRQVLDASGFWVDVEVIKDVGIFATTPENVAAACAYLGP